MKVGIVADGQAEAQALEHLMAKLRGVNLTCLKPVYADMQPYGPLPQIVRSAESRLSILNQRGANKVIVLLDREENTICPGEFSARLEREFAVRGFTKLSVVIKNKCFENWLIADPRSLMCGRRERIVVSDRIARRIEASGADNLNAATILNGCIKDGYNKRSDAIEICRSIDPHAVARHSRSFRKFLKMLGVSERPRVPRSMTFA